MLQDWQLVLEKRSTITVMKQAESVKDEALGASQIARQKLKTIASILAASRHRDDAA